MGVPTMYNYLLKHHAALPPEQQTLARCVFIKSSGIGFQNLRNGPSKPMLKGLKVTLKQTPSHTYFILTNQRQA